MNRNRTVGGGITFRSVPLADGEQLLAQIYAVYRVSRLFGRSGMLCFTNRRLMFAPRRDMIAPNVRAIDYAEIAEWHIDRQRQIGVGAILPFPRPALVIRTADGTEHVYLAAYGYDIATNATKYLPPMESAGQ